MSVTTNIPDSPVLFKQDQICQWYCCECGKSFGNVYYKDEHHQGGTEVELPKTKALNEEEVNMVKDNSFDYEYDLVSTVKYYSSIIYNSKNHYPKQECLTPVSSENVYDFDFRSDDIHRSNSVNLPVESSHSVQSLPSVTSSPDPDMASLEGTGDEIRANDVPIPTELGKHTTIDQDNRTFDDPQLSPLQTEESQIRGSSLDPYQAFQIQGGSVNRRSTDAPPRVEESSYSHYTSRYPDPIRKDSSKDKYLLDTPKRFNCNRCSHMMCPYCPKLRVRDLYK